MPNDRKESDMEDDLNPVRIEIEAVARRLGESPEVTGEMALAAEGVHGDRVRYFGLLALRRLAQMASELGAGPDWAPRAFAEGTLDYDRTRREFVASLLETEYLRVKVADVDRRVAEGSLDAKLPTPGV